MNKTVVLGCLFYIFQVFSGEHNVQRWSVVKAYEAVKRNEQCDHEGEAAMWHDLLQYIELKHKSRTQVLNIQEKSEQQKIKVLLVQEDVLSAADKDEDCEFVLLCPQGVRLLGQ